MRVARRSADSLSETTRASRYHDLCQQHALPPLLLPEHDVQQTRKLCHCGCRTELLTLQHAGSFRSAAEFELGFFTAAAATTHLPTAFEAEVTKFTEKHGDRRTRRELEAAGEQLVERARAAGWEDGVYNPRGASTLLHAVVSAPLAACAAVTTAARRTHGGAAGELAAAPPAAAELVDQQ